MIDRPPCPRCHGTRLLHSRSVLEVDGRDDRASPLWLVRPVAVRRDAKDQLRPVGRFETLVCTSCGLSRWYAFEWQAAVGKERRARCDECADETPQLRMSAVEHVAQGFDQPPLTRGWLGHEGRLLITVCRRCDKVRWTAAGHEQLDRHFFVGYTLRKELDRPCLECHSTVALLDPQAREIDGTPIPVAVRPPSRAAEGTSTPIGGYTLRLCRACAAVEWYANDPEQLAPSDEAQLVLVGAVTQTKPSGPYR